MNETREQIRHRLQAQCDKLPLIGGEDFIDF